jgi:hypothetical protein
MATKIVAAVGLIVAVGLGFAYLFFSQKVFPSQPSPSKFKEFSWGEDVRLTHDENASITTVRGRGLAVSENTLHLVWCSSAEVGNSEVYYMKSLNLGESWGEGVRLTNTLGKSHLPIIYTLGPKIYVAWSDERDSNTEIYFKCSTDGGTTWSVDTRLTEDTNSSGIPTLVARGNTVYLAWEDTRTTMFDVYYKRSTDGGLTWGTDTQLTSDAAESGAPSLAIDGEKLHLVYGTNRHGINNWEVYYRNFIGADWGSEVRLTSDENGDSRFPVVAASDSVVHVVWWDDRDDPKDRTGYPPIEPTGNYEVYYKRSTDGGTTWGPDTRLTFDNSLSMDPTIVAAGRDVYVVWSDNRDGNYEIYFKQSNNGGATWSGDVRLTNNPSKSYYPSVAVDGAGNVHVIWTDERDGNREVYYKRGTAGK